MHDARFRKYTIEMSHAILDGEGRWLHLAPSLGQALDAYVRTQAPHTNIDGFNIDDPKTWSDVAVHLWRNDRQIRAVEKSPTFTLRPSDIVIDVSNDARLGGMKSEHEVDVTDAAIRHRGPPMVLTNAEPAGEEPDEL